jgi:hypothetical protein
MLLLISRLIWDNYGTHKFGRCNDGCETSQLQSAFHAHLGQLLNQLERFFAESTNKRIRRGAFSSVRQSEQAIQDYLAHCNRDCKPFVWTANSI